MGTCLDDEEFTDEETEEKDQGFARQGSSIHVVGEEEVSTGGTETNYKMTAEAGHERQRGRVDA